MCCFFCFVLFFNFPSPRVLVLVGWLVGCFCCCCFSLPSPPFPRVCCCCCCSVIGSLWCVGLFVCLFLKKGWLTGPLGDSVVTAEGSATGAFIDGWFPHRQRGVRAPSAAAPRRRLGCDCSNMLCHLGICAAGLWCSLLTRRRFALRYSSGSSQIIRLLLAGPGDIILFLTQEDYMIF